MARAPTAVMSAAGPLRITVELDAAADPIRGTLEDGAGAPIAFTGWLELMSGFETVCDRASQAEDHPSAAD